MSEYKRHKGKLIPLSSEDNLEEECKKLCDSEGIELEDWESPIEYIRNGELNDNDKYIIVNGILYKNTNHIVSDEDYEYCNINKNSDGTMEYDTLFYDGHTDLMGMLEDNLG